MDTKIYRITPPQTNARQSTVRLDQPLTEHFSLREFVLSATAQRLGIDNTPKPIHVCKLRNLCRQVLEPLRRHMGQPIIINSGYRCSRLNNAVGGVPLSQHCRGEAADIRVTSLRQGLEMYAFILNNCPFDQLLFERSHRTGALWLHVSCKENVKDNRRMAIENYRAA